jgi:ribonuclease P protein component, eubacterial
LTKFLVIKKNEEFQCIFEKGHSIYGRYLVVYFLHTSFDCARFGFCVGKKVGNAVVRNHFKRLLREAILATATSGFEGFDILLVARNSIRSASLANIIFEITHILGKVKNPNHDQSLKKGLEREGSQ